MRFLRSASRGQSLVEAGIFIPLIVLLLFGTIFVSQVGVLAERTQLTVRYGAMVASNSVYSAATIYSFLAQPSGSVPTCPAPPTGVLTDAAPFPGPVSATYWQPSSATSSCATIVHSVGGSQFLLSSIYVAQQNTVATHIPVLSYLTGIVGGNTINVGASEPFARAADPSVFLYCSQEVNNRVRNAVMGALQPQPAPTPTPASSSSPSPLYYNC